MSTPPPPVVFPPLPVKALLPPWLSPMLSVVTALLSLGTTVYIFRSTNDMNSKNLRPFVRVTFKQTSVLQATRGDNGMTGKAIMSGAIRIKNSGKSPAYRIGFDFKSKAFSCTHLKPFDLGPDEQTTWGAMLTCDRSDSRSSPFSCVKSGIA